MSTKTMNQVIANDFKTQEDCTFGTNIGGKEYDNKQSIAQSRCRRVRTRLHAAPDVQHGRGAAGGLYAADAKGHLPQATGSRLLQVFTVDWNDEIGFAPRYLYERGMAA